MPLNILLYGAPGSGKGSMSELIVRDYGMVHISVGNLLREEVEKGTPLGREVAARMNEGLMITDEIVVRIIKPLLLDREVAKKGILLDGFPRTLNQAKALSAIGFAFDALLFFKVDEKVVEERCINRRVDPVTGHIYNLKSDPPPKDIIHRLTIRPDDTREKHQRRMKVFYAHADALLNYYQDKVVEINCDMPRNEVYASLKTQLNRMIEQKRKMSKL